MTHKHKRLNFFLFSRLYFRMINHNHYPHKNLKFENDYNMDKQHNINAYHLQDNVSPKNISAELVERFKPLREAGLVCRGKYSGGYLLLAHAKDKTPITVLWKPDKKSLKETVDRCK